ncbi:Outer membrane porin F precursor [Mariniflexile rhizosphaerae]|uniref:OmpA family protein n=1 Tax=unclassified Mariniflexile TaxID=2643887 RepID=UPI000E330DD9|nr:OmpA family protein [Mariniflexile sp. TRM1-10]AXP79294.1 Outer membrane porin F precursor [Mariniflexile sp. TRM1-10]
MKKITFVFMLVVSSFSLQAQSYLGFLTDNYSGVNSVIANPANIVDSRFKTDINLVGISTFGGNDYYGVNIFDAIKKDYDFDLEAKKSPTTDNNAALNVDIMGPSFMFNINERNSIAIFTRARSFVNVNDINGTSIDAIDDDVSDDFNLNEGDFNAFGQAWAEVGITYARVLFNKDEHFLKGGLSLKYLQGGGSGYVYGKNVTVDYDADGSGPDTASLTSTGQLTYGRFDNFDNDNYDYELPDATGFGADLGFVYEWRPNHADYTTTNADGASFTRKDKNKYKLKLGLSITDLGSINYKEALEETFDITNNVSEDDIENEDDLNDILNNLYTQTDSKTGYKTTLPTALHLNADWSFNSKFYVNLNTDFSLVSKNKMNASRISNTVSLTPRFESKWFSFYLPLSVVENNGFQIGTGLRAGPLYVGSGSILSALTSDNSKGADVYAGIKIPIYQGKPKDRDKDGIINKLDKCPKEAGPIENNGCPWGDKDSDGVLDNEDVCPETAGPIENKGCPWGDKDADTVLDNVDGCPEIAGPIENNGCPWKDSDNDGVLDKDDACVDVPGTVANNGCPEEKLEPIVTEEVQKSLNEYAKTILFDSGKSTIKTVSYGVLDEITTILGEYPNAKFSIEGHTDSVGSDVSNLKLSESRASSVMTFLIEKGVASNRLTSTGFGESKPIADNTTNEGRAQNRRVEINLVK